MSKRRQRRKEQERRDQSKARKQKREPDANEKRRILLRGNWQKVTRLIEEFQDSAKRYPFAVLVDNANIFAVDSAAGVIRAVKHVLPNSERLQKELMAISLDSEDCFVLVNFAGGIMRTTYQAWAIRLEAEKAGAVTIPYNAGDFLQ